MNTIVTVISKEMIKPSSSQPIDHHYKLSFLDQLIPTTFVPLIFFYPSNESFNNPHFSSNLKISLSQTLSTFFPFSGRLKHNFSVHNFNEGVPFTETKVSSELSEFLHNPQIKMLNQFLPVLPFSRVSDPVESLPLLHVQLNTFQCGGIALGVCVSHKIADAQSLCSFLRAWADTNSDQIQSSNEIKIENKINPNFDEALMRFPPFESHQKYLSIMESLMFSERKWTTRRFVFDSSAISSLKEKAATKNKKGDNISPTRTKTVSSFIWKCCTKASASVSEALKLSLSIHTVNVRRRIDPQLPETSIGDLFWWATAAYPIKDRTKLSELKDFAALTSESVEGINAEFLKHLEGEKGVEMAFGFLDRMSEMNSINPEMILFSSWMNFEVNEIDFGWGKAAWVGLMGEVGLGSGNFVVFKETMEGDGIEAWMTLDEGLMEILKGDSEFLTFATPNPAIV